MNFRTESYDDLRAMLIGKYGLPSSEQVEEVQNGFGAVFRSRSAGWNFLEGVLRLHQHRLNLEKGWLVFENPDADKEIGILLAIPKLEEGKKAF